MKAQFISSIALALLGGLVTATPVPMEATNDVVPSIPDALMNTGGNLVATLFQAFTPGSVFDGARTAAGLQTDPMNNGRAGLALWGRDAESEGARPGISRNAFL